MSNLTEIRHETSTDIPAIRQLHQKAFDGNEEANIVDNLRENCKQILSLVATIDNKLVGHILFSPVRIETDSQQTFHGMGLAPMAVLPSHQRRGIGGALIEQGLAQIMESGSPFVVVLGHPDYYPRFGFLPASNYGVRCQWEGVPDEAFMLRLLDDGLRNELTGTAYYSEEFTA